MAYFAPYIDGSGLHVPSYPEIRDQLITEMKNIFGQDIYIDEDTQDYQQISIFAKKIFDTNALAVLVYNNRTPITAIGVGLDNLCALVGITRHPATYSTVQLTITGDAGTVIINGEASDGTYTWNLPPSVTIPSNGTITVEAKCDTSGTIGAAPNTITTILTPVYGWLSVTNNYSANQGQDVETDAELRGRFSTATYQPSETVMDGITAGLQGINGVTRVKGYENDTNLEDANGLPPHSISYVVEGGTNEEVALQIYHKKTPGVYTYGTTSVNVTGTGGSVNVIRFYRPTYKNVYTKINITKLSGYNDSYVDAIKVAVKEYIDNLEIAETVYRSVVWSVATTQMTDILSPAFSVTDVQFSTDGTIYNTNDVAMAFNEAAQIELANIQVVVT